MPQLILWIYSRFTLALAPFLRLKLRRRATYEALYGEHVAERFGHYVNSDSSERIWIHAVSLGETRAASILLTELRRRDPSLRFLLTHGTATGRAEGAKLLTPRDVQAWQPWDTPEATRSLLTHFRPRIGIIMETEVWPQLCAAARAENVPLVLANARLSERSLRRMRWLPSLMKPAMNSFLEIWAQTNEDADRLKTTGGNDIRVLGNLKFDIHPPASLMQRGAHLKQRTPKPVVMLASSREGEEDLFLHALLQSRAQHRSNANSGDLSVQWMIVPRHPQRFAQVQQMCKAKGLSVSLRSAWSDAPGEADIWLGDSIGEMPLYYSLASVALLGGSFEKLGGQNLIESIACDCPVVMGPHTFNFEQACQQAESIGAARRVKNMMEAVEVALQLTEQPHQLQQMRAAAGDWLKVSKGAALRMADRVMLIVDGSTETREA